jgi:hypothetical protein
MARLTLRTHDDVATLLGISPKYLKLVLRLAPRYKVFHIPKKTGGLREIAAPTGAILQLQKKLLPYLESLYAGRTSAHGFIKGKSIHSNAEPHSRSRFVLNIDLENFFPTIHFGRIRGMLMGKPYYVGKAAATIIADLCCRSGMLPQGAPTSPVLSNMICAQLDSQLKALAKQYYCTYTRYADDLTFSTKARSFPKAIAEIPTDIGGQLEVGEDLALIIQRNGFKINQKKVRLATRHQRQEVTGLTTNRFPNVQRRFIRQIRAMLHAWERHGYDLAQHEFSLKYDKRANRLNGVYFSRVVRGKIEFVGSIRGKTDPLYWRLLRKYAKLIPNYILKEPNDFVEYDVKELKKALWVLMDDSGQSTAFFLKGFGLVTCAHAITNINSLYVIRPDDPLETPHPVVVVAKDDKRDLALLKAPFNPPKELHFGDDSEITQGIAIRLLGFPKHHTNADVSVAEGHVVHQYEFEKMRRFHISVQIIKGNSGGPLLNSRNQVVGVAIKGGTDELNAVVPISYLLYLRETEINIATVVDQIAEKTNRAEAASSKPSAENAG